MSPPKLAVELRADTCKLLNKTHPLTNITLQEDRAIKELKTDQSRIILTGDKGVAMLIRDRQGYTNKAEVLPFDKDTYRPISKDPIPKLKNQLMQILPKDMLTKPPKKTLPYMYNPSQTVWITQDP